MQWHGCDSITRWPDGLWFDMTWCDDTARWHGTLARCNGTISDHDAMTHWAMVHGMMWRHSALAQLDCTAQCHNLRAWRDDTTANGMIWHGYDSKARWHSTMARRNGTMQGQDSRAYAMTRWAMVWYGMIRRRDVKSSCNGTMYTPLLTFPSTMNTFCQFQLQIGHFGLFFYLQIAENSVNIFYTHEL